MHITTRPATDKDRGACLWAEEGAIPGYGYLDDTWELFLRGTKGDLTCALADGELGGIGKLTQLYNTYGWLETLRIHPNYQNKGLGKAIYKRYLEEMKELGLTAIGMYTGTTNLTSKGLAEIHEDKAESWLEKVQKEMGKFVCINRTFYPLTPGLMTHFAKAGYLYGDKEGNFIIIGARFQPQTSQHIACMLGDKDKCLRFAHMLATKRAAKNITCVYSFKQTENQKFLLENNFICTTDDLITLWLGLN